VFFWVVLVVRLIKKRCDGGASHSEISKSLQEVPEKLQELIGAILHSPDNALLRTMRWILFSLKSLSLEELYFAIRTGIGQLTSGVWNTSEVDRDDMKAFILTSSRGLVEIEPWHGSSLISEAQLVHESVREYLITGGLKDLGPSSNKMVEANDHARLFKWCSTYIRLNTRFIATDGIDIRASEDTRTTYPLLGYAVDAVLSHFEIAGIAGALPLGHLPELPLQQYIHTCSIYSNSYSALITCSYRYYIFPCTKSVHSLLGSCLRRAHCIRLASTGESVRAVLVQPAPVDCSRLRST
jgi:hypothetical protein